MKYEQFTISFRFLKRLPKKWRSTLLP